MSSDDSTLSAPGAAPLDARALEASLTVDDLERSVAWYRAAPGFTVEREHERNGRKIAVTLRAGEVRILLGQDDGAPGSQWSKGECSPVRTRIAGGVDEVAERVGAHGEPIDTEPTDPPRGARVCRVKDPDGFRFAIST